MKPKKPYNPKYPISGWSNLLSDSWKSGTYQGITYGYTSPSPDWNRAPGWLWDSCFHAFMWARIDPERAKSEIRTHLRFIYGNGNPPMMLFLEREGLLKRLFERVFYKKYLVLEQPGTILTQPPIHAETVWEIYQRTGDKNFLAETAPDLMRVYDFFANHRDLDQDGLVSIMHPLESGTDSLPEFDEALYGRRGGLPMARFIINFFQYRKYHKLKWNSKKIFKKFDFESSMFNTLFALNLESLVKILKELQDPNADRYEAMRQKTINALISQCWDPGIGIFKSLYSSGHKRTKVKTVAGLIPIVLDLPPDIIARLVEHLKNPIEFATDYPVPSVSRDEPTFYPGATVYLWRGTSWINTNWYIVRGLIKHGYDDLAKDITKKTIEMVKMSGFREYYNPLTGEGYGDKEHGWSTLVVDMAERCGLKLE